MVASTYDEALKRVLVHEGGYSNHPSDPGGPTNFGITIYDYRKYVKPGATAADVRTMRLDDAKAIYRVKYWGAMGCDDLPPGLDYAMFDYGVNSGCARAIKVLQRILGLVDNGKVTDAVIAATKKNDIAKLVVALCDERLRFLRSLKTWPVFGGGWGRRVAEVKTAALAMVDSAGAPAPTARIQGRGLVPSASGAQKAAAGGVVAAGVAVAHQAEQAGADITIILVVVAVTAAIAGLGWIAFYFWRKRKQETPASISTTMKENP
jgi:lysozyme family protein